MVLGLFGEVEGASAAGVASVAVHGDRYSYQYIYIMYMSGVCVYIDIDLSVRGERDAGGLPCWDGLCGPPELGGCWAS